jgi:hypothetical protein
LCLYEQAGIALHQDQAADHSDIIEPLRKAIALYMTIHPNQSTSAGTTTAYTSDRGQP